MAKRPPRPQPVTVANTRPWAVVYDSDGRSLPGSGRTTANATDPVTARLIGDRTLHVIQQENA